MQLDRLTARIRPRTSWEGLDLGFALARNRFPALWGIWCFCSLPVAAFGVFWLPAHPDLWLLLVWWFKPLYEAPILYWLSRALFGASLNPGDLWRERRQVLPRRLLPNLLWRRFQLSRSFQLPLTLLEGLRGPERRQRKRVMQSKDSTGTWLTLICLHLESILWSSALVLALFLVPDGLPRMDTGAALFEVESSAYWFSVVLYWLAMSVIAPFYVAAGFSLYLTRRTELEAWDLELVFRRAGTEEGRKHHWGSTAAGCATLLALTLGTAPPAEAAPEDLDPGQMKELTAEVLAGEDFGGKREIQAWVYVGDGMGLDAEPSLPDWLLDLLKLLARGADLTAPLAKWLLILAAAVLVALVAHRVLLELRGRSPRRATTMVPDQPLLQLGHPDAETLPSDIPRAVRALIEAGNPRAALALLYRASLARLVLRHGLEIPESATESECLALAADGRPAAETALLRHLTKTWQRQAYAHRSPEAPQLTALLEDWQAWQGEVG